MRSVTVAFATFQESIRQPAFYALLVIGVMLLLFSYVLPTFQLDTGEVKFVRDIGLGTFSLCILLLGIFSASNLITTEIENKTAMTVMSKPLRRHEFVLGKYMGIGLALAFLGLFLTVVFLAVIVGKVAGGDIVYRKVQPYQAILPEITVVFPGLFLGFLQALILVAVSVALSIRLPMILNVSISFALFILANISGPLVDYLAREHSIFTATARYIFYVLPNLRSAVEVNSAIGLGRFVPASFVAWAAVYSLLYIAAALSFAVFLFQDKELG
ncbi:MAG: ABC transporter permease [Planctomycetes bacterium]|nr:ABC transporter permease [Planctomycetota bacterium]